MSGPISNRPKPKFDLSNIPTNAPLQKQQQPQYAPQEQPSQKPAQRKIEQITSTKRQGPKFNLTQSQQTNLPKEKPAIIEPEPAIIEEPIIKEPMQSTFEKVKEQIRSVLEASKMPNQENIEKIDASLTKLENLAKQGSSLSKPELETLYTIIKTIEYSPAISLNQNQLQLSELNKQIKTATDEMKALDQNLLKFQNELKNKDSFFGSFGARSDQEIKNDISTTRSSKSLKEPELAALKFQKFKIEESIKTLEKGMSDFYHTIEDNDKLLTFYYTENKFKPLVDRLSNIDKSIVFMYNQLGNLLKEKEKLEKEPPSQLSSFFSFSKSLPDVEKEIFVLCANCKKILSTRKEISNELNSTKKTILMSDGQVYNKRKKPEFIADLENLLEQVSKPKPELKIKIEDEIIPKEIIKPKAPEIMPKAPEIKLKEDIKKPEEKIEPKDEAMPRGGPRGGPIGGKRGGPAKELGKLDEAKKEPVIVRGKPIKPKEVIKTEIKQEPDLMTELKKSFESKQHLIKKFEYESDEDWSKEEHEKEPSTFSTTSATASPTKSTPSISKPKEEKIPKINKTLLSVENSYLVDLILQWIDKKNRWTVITPDLKAITINGPNGKDLTIRSTNGLITFDGWDVKYQLQKDGSYKKL